MPRAEQELWLSGQALDAVTFDVRTGEIFGFIGADGAGKTTAFRIIGGVLEPGAEKFGSSELRLARRARRGISHAAVQPLPDLSVDENLNYAGGLREVPEEDFNERRERYFKLFDIDRIHRPAGGAAERRHEAEAGADRVR